MGKYILSLDQGTSSSRAILFDKEHNIVGISQNEISIMHPKEAWVEQDPMEIYSSVYSAMMELIAKTDIKASDICAIGIANQRETTVIWDKNTGRPICNAIVWQDRRSSDIVDGLVALGFKDHIRKVTGLVPDAYFSATKIKWILDNVPNAAEKAESGQLLFGTVDTWLIWKLTNGAVHVTDYTNASRTMLYDIENLRWDDKLLEALEIPKTLLPEVRNSSEIYGEIEIFGEKIPIAGACGDQQAALFGQACFSKYEIKNTYGTGCFLLMNTGDEKLISSNGLITTIAIGLEGKVWYALEGSIFTGGAVVRWLRDEMRIIAESRDAEYYANKVNDTDGVYFVPSFTGLGAPHWDTNARGCIIGITGGTRSEHIIRAALESIAFQSMDLVVAMEKDSGFTINSLNVDGGASVNDFLMQFQADVLNKTILRPVVSETTALGAAYLAGMAVGMWKDTEEIKGIWKSEKEFIPEMDNDCREKIIKGWEKAVNRSLNWTDS